MKCQFAWIMLLVPGLAGGCACLPGPTPLELREKRVVVGAGVLTKSVFFRQDETAKPRMTYITEIAELGKAGKSAREIAVFDCGDFWLVDPHTRVARWVTSHRAAGGRPCLVDVDGDGTPEIVCRGGGFSDVGLLDSTGKLLWKKPGGYTTESTANWMSGGDLDRDGATEFYVAASDGLYSFAADGSRTWRVGRADEMYWGVELFDSKIVSERQIVASIQRRGRYQPRFLEFRDHHGNLMRRVKPARCIGRFRLLRWPIDAKPLRILARSGSAVVILDRDGLVVWEYKIPRKFGHGFGVEGAFVRFSDDEDPYLAVLLGGRAGWRRSVLCVFSLDGNLVYQEILAATTGMLATRLENAAAPGETLLIGDGKGKVVSYRRTRDAD